MAAALQIPMEPSPRCVTVEEYLAFEETSAVRTEYLNGRIYCQGVPFDPDSITDEELRAMAGAMPDHNRLLMNLGAVLINGIGGKSCDVYSSDQRVQLVGTDDYVYPDITFCCGTPIFLITEKPYILTNPLIIVEVLSPSTQKYDLNDKAAAYRQIESLQEILFVSPERVWVEHHARQNAVNWIRTTYDDITLSLRLSSLDCDVPLRKIYRNFEFE